MDTELIPLILNDKRIRLVAFFVFVTLLIYFLFSFTTNARITVTTNNSNNIISLIKISKNGVQSTISSTQDKELSATVRSGNYEISASNKQSGITKDIVIKSRQSKKYKLDIPTPTDPVSVLPNGASALAANSQIIYYLDPESNNIYRLSADGIPALISTTQFVNVQWANATFGVGQGQDGKLYTINNGSVSLLLVPFNHQGVGISYSVGPTGMVYIPSGGTVYAGQNGQNFKKFFNSNSSSLSLFAGKNSLAIVASADNDASSNGTIGPAESPGNLIVVNDNGKEIASSKLDVSSIVWSPNSDKLAASGDDGRVVIYNNFLAKITTITNNTSPVIWINDNVVAYGHSSSLWKYDIKHSQGLLLSSTPEGESISKVWLGDDPSYVYFSATDLNTQSSILLRVGLNAQANNVPSYYSGLSVLFPNSTQQCSFSYSIFNKPYLLITSQQNKGVCLQQAQAELSTYGLPESGFNIAYASQ